MIQKLKLQNFRSYSLKTFEFGNQANIIVGPNAAGKTNILEAVLVSRLGSSYRAKDLELISFNKPWARIDVLEDKALRTVKIDSTSIPPKSFVIGDKIYKRLPSSQKLPTVLFEPNHLQLLIGAPEARRVYLDSFIEQVSPEYGQILRAYTRTLMQRNNLLKSFNRPKASQMFPWNVRLSQLAGQIIRSRSERVKSINQLLTNIYTSLSGDQLQTKLKYKSKFGLKDYESEYLKKLDSNFDEDLRIGFTSYGPHRDDFVFTFDGHSSNLYASRGELRTAILALKVTELETISAMEFKPIVLLDDVYSELDNSRRQALTHYLKNHQSFITTTDGDAIIKQIKSISQVIKLAG